MGENKWRLKMKKFIGIVLCIGMICCNFSICGAKEIKNIEMDSTDKKMLEALQTLYKQVESSTDENTVFLSHIHIEAERIRNRYGYSGGDSGDEYKELKNTIVMEIPNNATGNFKTYMDYRSITNRRSTQWMLQTRAYTNDNGFRMIDGKYLVAMGTYYGTCGEEFIITLSNGQEINVIIGDIKDNRHTDATNRYIPRNGNIVEFIIDTNKINSMSRRMGDVSHSGLYGDIIKIEKII